MRWITSFLLFSGCLPNNTLETWAQSQQNVDNIVRIQSGMSAEEVMHIMHQPYRIETYQVGEDSYEAWFYITRGTALGQSKPFPKNLTPLILKDGVLLGRGYDYYRWLLRKKENYLLDVQESEALKNNAGEDKKLEKALDVTMSKAPPKEPKPEPAAKKKPAKEPEEGQEKKGKVPFTPEDENRIEEESEQNFNYW